MYLGRVSFRNDDRVFGIKREDRFAHIYAIGKTGTGKSTLLEGWQPKTSQTATASP
jgi:hypothetical protein